MANICLINEDLRPLTSHYSLVKEENGMNLDTHQARCIGMNLDTHQARCKASCLGSFLDSSGTGVGRGSHRVSDPEAIGLGKLGVGSRVLRHRVLGTITSGALDNS